MLICRNIDSKSFLIAFQKHIFEYGVPSRIISDNGSPIVGSVKIVGNILNDSSVMEFLSEKNIKHLKFEPYPAHASYLGGIVESLVKQVKNMTYSVIRKNILDYDNFDLLVSECMMLINKRPLFGESMCSILDDPSVPVLTPELLVRGYDIPSISILPSDNDDNSDDPSFIDRESALSRLCSSFKKLKCCQSRLRSFYYDSFMQRLLDKSLDVKGRYDQRRHDRLEVGDLVAVKSLMCKPYFYPVGLVKSVELNDLNEVTTVTLRKGNGECIRRHVTDVILLEKNSCLSTATAEPESISSVPRRSARLANRNKT